MTLTLSGAADKTQETVVVPIQAVAVPYDAAQRLAMQTGFGPRADVIARIQKIGMAAYIQEQIAQSPDIYPTNEQPNTHFLRLALGGNATLRQRTAWAFQTFIPEMAFSEPKTATTWEVNLEKHAFSSFKQILLDSASTLTLAFNFNLLNNFASTEPGVNPNQNYARELMQLFSLGGVLLNEDGTPILDNQGRPMPTYTEETVRNLARVFTGWSLGTPIDPAYTFGGIYDYSAPLAPLEQYHDHGSKTLFETVTLPAGQTAAVDRDQALEAIFQHPTLPPFVCRILIQRFVKSQPSPEYVRRVVRIFKNDGSGKRGNLAAVISAILLDPEARSGDLSASATDGFLQEPLYFQLAAMQLLDISQFDDNPIYYPGQFGEPWWHATSVFAYFSPSYLVPGTAINSPEFQLLDNISITQRTQFLWGVVTANAAGYPLGGKSQLYTQFPTLTSLVDALNHILYHGTMSPSLQAEILSYCSTIADHDLQLKSAAFLALSSDSFTVVN